MRSSFDGLRFNFVRRKQQLVDLVFSKKALMMMDNAGSIVCECFDAVASYSIEQAKSHQLYNTTPLLHCC